MKANKTKSRLLALAIVLVFLVAYVGFAYTNAVKSLAPTVRTALNNPGPRYTPLAWPAYGQAAVATKQFGMIASNGPTTSLPCASVAKVLTAYMVLKAKPLSAGQDGPDIQFSQADVDIYDQYVAVGGSVVPVYAGEQMSEYQALQAMLLPSANNIADSLAIWAYGSMQTYLNAANQTAKSLGMNSTHLADASGFSPNTVSSAQDLVKLGITATDNPVIADVVSQKTATIPDVGEVDNVNQLLGKGGIVGIKTGNTDQAGGVFLLAGKYSPVAGGAPVTVISAIMGAPDLQQAMMDSLRLAQSSYNNFSTLTYVKEGQVLGYYQAPWGQKVNIVAADNATMTIWNQSAVTMNAHLQPLNAPFAKGTTAGSITVNAGKSSITVQAVTDGRMTPPSLGWRLMHP